MISIVYKKFLELILILEICIVFKILNMHSLYFDYKMFEKSYISVCEAYEDMYKKLPQRKVLKVSAAIPMLMEEGDDRDNSVRKCKKCGGRVLKDGKCDTCNSVIEPLTMEEDYSDENFNGIDDNKEDDEHKMFSDKLHSSIDSIFDFFRNNDVKIDPLPKICITFEKNETTDPFIPTGCYDGEDKKITLCCSNRHIKDILRTFCHELMHHNQNLLNPENFKRLNKIGKLCDNADLSDMESDAYARGNVMFRKWTESFD